MAEQESSCSQDEEKGIGISEQIECAICLQNCVYPVQLPCKHIFCYLCVKGVTLQSKRCAMCRREIPQDYLFNPELINKEAEEEGNQLFDDEFQWFYEGRNGWWQYDKRTSLEIENHHKNGSVRCELLIAGFLYIIDFEHMLQYRRNDPSRRRKVKRDVATGPKKGVAGLRIGVETDPTTNLPESATDQSRDRSPGVDAARISQRSDLSDRLRISTQDSANLDRLLESIQNSENLHHRRLNEIDDDDNDASSEGGTSDGTGEDESNRQLELESSNPQIDAISGRLIDIDLNHEEDSNRHDSEDTII